MNDEIKYFEIRDRGTFIPVMCIRIINTMADVQTSPEGRQEYLLHRSGYAYDKPYVFMWGLEGGLATYDPFDWGNRTRLNAHVYIQEHWDELNSGDVVDVEFILGEANTKKISEQFETNQI